MPQTENLRVNILLENKNDRVIASALELPSYRVEAATRELALKTLEQLLATHLKNTEIVPVEIKVSQATGEENPWIKFAGFFKDDPYFAQIAEAIRAERESNDDSEVDPSMYMVE
ncbi:hypothetical protein [Iningainema tapete]|uniref:Uncharacterized protein n=1 Tax=Iningainema tapete BLCC-T55 TaxID=2748662 RepID=A0A8J7C6K1_9CYAN|nr:hypothetical protein [Iningainema tapete]MBD2774434.1 hypothetical protein [Iningainema tapete BLCC-T55]